MADHQNRRSRVTKKREIFSVTRDQNSLKFARDAREIRYFAIFGPNFANFWSN